MWKLILADSFHFNNIGYQTSFMTLCMSFYINFLLRMRDSKYMFILLLWVIFLVISLLISPIRIANGLYLCPLTEDDRKRYLKLSFYFRYIIHEVVFAVILISAGFIKHFDHRILLLIYISVSIGYLVILLLSGFYNPEMVKRQYLIMNKRPLPTKKQSPSGGNYQTPMNGVYLLITTLIFSCIGLVLPGFSDRYDNRWLLYYIPAFTLCFLCILFYFLRYFDLFITINANYESYSFTHKKKAGVH